MTTYLLRNLGDQFSDQNGIPLAGYNLYYYQSGTTNLQDTYLEQTGTTKNTNPIVLNSAGRLTTPVYLGSSNDYKEVLTNPNGVVYPPWPFDGIPKAVTVSAPLTGFERLYMPWAAVSTSPQAIGAAAVGTAYEYNAALGAITVNLPSIASVQAGTGFTFKKTDNSANAIAITPNGSDQIEGFNAPVYIGVSGMTVGITSDGAQWLATLFSSIPFMLAAQRQSVTAGAGALTIDVSKGWVVALSLTGTVTSMTLTRVPPAGTLFKLQLEITNTGAFNITGWPTTTHWYAGMAPTVTSGAGKMDTFVITCNDGGTSYRGYTVAQNLV